MSMDTDSPQPDKSHKKTKINDIKHSSKKRKRHLSTDIEPAPPTKKHQPLSQPDSAKNPRQAPNSSETPTPSSFVQQTSSLYLSLSPISQKHALQGLCAEHLSPLILTYYPPFHGIVISYSNARLSTDPYSTATPVCSKAVDEYAASFVWLTADFVIFKPQRGNLIEGWVNLQNESNLGLLCYNFFNVTIERRRLARGWKWMSGGVKSSTKRKLKKAAQNDSNEDTDMEEEAAPKSIEDAQGYFQDENGKKVEGLIRFRVKDVETSRSMDRESSFMNIEGTMLSEQEEKDLQQEEASKMKMRNRKQPRHTMSGALMNQMDGAMDVDESQTLTSSLKHRAKY